MGGSDVDRGHGVSTLGAQSIDLVSFLCEWRSYATCSFGFRCMLSVCLKSKLFEMDVVALGDGGCVYRSLSCKMNTKCSTICSNEIGAWQLKACIIFDIMEVLVNGGIVPFELDVGVARRKSEVNLVDVEDGGGRDACQGLNDYSDA